MCWLNKIKENNLFSYSCRKAYNNAQNTACKLKKNIWCCYQNIENLRLKSSFVRVLQNPVAYSTCHVGQIFKA